MPSSPVAVAPAGSGSPLAYARNRALRLCAERARGGCSDDGYDAGMESRLGPWGCGLMVGGRWKQAERWARRACPPRRLAIPSARPQARRLSPLASDGRATRKEAMQGGCRPLLFLSAFDQSSHHGR